MKTMAGAILLGMIATTSANAAGLASIHQSVKRSGNGAGKQVLASCSSLSGRTPSGERFIASGNPAAARTWPIGTSLTVTNPANGQSVVVRVNDHGPFGRAY